MSPTANAANAAECPRSSRNGMANSVIAIPANVAIMNAPASSQNPAERSAASAPVECRAAGRVLVAGAGRRTSACSGTVIAARIAARTSSASRQPSAPMSACDSGTNMKLASAATSVSVVSARRRSAASAKCLARTVNAGS